MTIPNYQKFMLPFLEILGDQQEHNLQEIYEKLSDYFNLSPDDKQERLPSGRQLKFQNRIGWARTYLKKAGLLKHSGRGKFIITPRGLEVLKEKPKEINVKYLERFEEFLEFRNPNNPVLNGLETTPESEKNQTPEEILENSYQDLKSDLMGELLETVKNCSANFFEKLVIDLLVSMGYGGSRIDAGQAIGKSGDEGIDGIIKEDKLGLDVVYVQAKRWQNPVGRPVVQAFAGSLEGQRARKGILITTSRFTEEALEYVKKIEKKIVLIDGKKLAELMIDFNVGVSPKAEYVVKVIDTDYFEEG